MRIKSHTELYPAAPDVFNKLLDELLASKYEGWIHFDGPKKETWVEVANEPDHLVLLFCYPYKNDLNKALFEAGISVPGPWRLEKFNPKRLGGLVGGSAMFLAPRDQAAELTGFINQLFIKFYNCGPNYKVSGYSTNI
ncbi:MAG TPA: hypothetical protein VMH87_05990 [Pseudomonadales bacterium]|nr:hypothetical protein [Pseudomonadales bacterium]